MMLHGNMLHREVVVHGGMMLGGSDGAQGSGDEASSYIFVIMCYI